MIQVIPGNSFVEIDKFPENYFDSVVTDPPYGLESIQKRFGKNNSAPAKYGSDGRFSRLSKGFLGQEWDGTGIEKNKFFWQKVFRVIKPGAYLLSFGGTRTSHRIACAIEDAGFEIRDTIGWLYAQGFPKSHDLGNGVGTSLKPAFEPIIVARKPISEGTNIRNVERWGVGGINIDDTRIPIVGEEVPINRLEAWSGFGQVKRPEYKQEINTRGRWPANLVVDDSGLLGENSKFFFCAKPSKKERGVAAKHPTVKPVRLMEWLVRLVTPSGGLVLDPFFGTGTTGIACGRLGYSCIGIELAYYELCLERIKENE